MYFDSLNAVMSMDGHGMYVWLAYGVTAAVITTVLIAPLRRRKRLLQQLAMELKRVGDVNAAGES